MEFQVIFYTLSILHVSVCVSLLPGPCPSQTVKQSKIDVTNIFQVIGSVKHSTIQRSILDGQGTKKPCSLRILVRNIHCSEFYGDCPLDQGFIVKGREDRMINTTLFGIPLLVNSSVQKSETGHKLVHSAILWPCENINEIHFEDIGFLVICEIVVCEVLVKNISIDETKGSLETYVRSNFFSEVVWEDDGPIQKLCTSKILKVALMMRNRLIFISIFVFMIVIIFYLLWLNLSGNNRIFPMA